MTITHLEVIMTRIDQIDGRVLPIIGAAGAGERATANTEIDPENEEMGVTGFLFGSEASADAALAVWEYVSPKYAWFVRTRTPDGLVVVNLIQHGAELSLPLELFDMRGGSAQPLSVDTVTISLLPAPKGYITLLDL